MSLRRAIGGELAQRSLCSAHKLCDYPIWRRFGRVSAVDRFMIGSIVGHHCGWSSTVCLGKGCMAARIVSLVPPADGGSRSCCSACQNSHANLYGQWGYRQSRQVFLPVHPE